jgi:hypothetical protein
MVAALPWTTRLCLLMTMLEDHSRILCMGRFQFTMHVRLTLVSPLFASRCHFAVVCGCLVVHCLVWSLLVYVAWTTAAWSVFQEHGPRLPGVCICLEFVATVCCLDHVFAWRSLLVYGLNLGMLQCNVRSTN